MKTIVVNFKANKNDDEVINWVNKFHFLQTNLTQTSNIEIIICPPFTALELVRRIIRTKKWNFPLRLGAQNVSDFQDGAYTGEVTARMLVKLVDFVIIGHSERSKYFSENRKSVNKKINLLRTVGLKPIVCIAKKTDIQTLKTIEYKGLVAYEPFLAIGSGRPEPPNKIELFANIIKKTLTDTAILYGGSISVENCQDSLNIPSIAGLLIGKAALDPQVFFNIIKSC